MPPTGAGPLDPAIFWIEDPSLTRYRQQHILQIILSTLSGWLRS